MRQAARDDAWRRLAKRKYDAQIVSALLEGIAGLPSSELTFEAGLTLICGGNGTGKSTLLRCLYACLVPSYVKGNMPFRRRVAGGRCRIKLRLAATDIELETVFDSCDGESDMDGFTLIESADYVPRLVDWFRATTDLEAQLKGVEAKRLSGDELARLGYIVGRTYEAVEVYEVEVPGEDVTYPYFSVTAGQWRYGSEAMGYGELSAFVMLWVLERAKSGELLFIEEPELFLSPRGQAALIDVLAMAALSRGVSIVATTHSPPMVGRAMPRHVRLMTADSTATTFDSPGHGSAALRILGLELRKEGIVFVEDLAAQELVGTVLLDRAPWLLEKFCVLRAGDKDAVLRVVSLMTCPGQPFQLVGLLDGDQRDAIASPVQKCIGFLPGRRAPDMDMLDAVRLDVSRFCVLLGGDPVTVRGGVAAIAGVDAHDWAVELSRQTGAKASEVWRAMARCWIERNEEMAAAIVDDVARLAAM